MVKLNDVGFDLMIDSRPVKFIQSRAKFYALIPEVLLLAGAYDKVTFFSILDRCFVKRDDIYEIILNISDNWAAKAPYEEGEIILKDDFTDEPYISSTFPIDVKDRSKLKFTPIQKNWLYEWFHGKGELSKEEAKKVQKKTKMERSFAMGEMAMATPEAQRAFKIAENKGYIIKNGDHYAWNASFSYSLLGFFLGLLFCNDKVVIDHHQLSIKKGKDFNSASYFKRLFGGIDVGKYRRDLLNKTSYPPPGWEEIEKIVNEAKATV